MERNLRLDYFKIFLSLLVVTIHLKPLLPSHDTAAWLISNGIARIAVPVFFIINGYYIYSKLDKTKELRSYIKYLLIIYLTWSVIYSPYWVSLDYKKETLLNLLFGYYHLWYVPALIVGILFLFLIKKIVHKDNHILIISLLLFLTGYFINREYHNLFFVYRSGITLAFPFIALGYYIRSEKLERIIPDKLLILCIFWGSIGILVESYHQFVFYQKTHFHQDFFLSLLLICPATFIYVIKHPILSSGKSFINILSTGIYFIHPLIIFTLHIPIEYTIYKYVLVVFISIILSYIFYLLNKRINIFF